jgi:hypothetical protein
LCLEGPGAGSTGELPAPDQEPLERSKSKEEASSNWVAHFDSAHFQQLFSPTGQLRKYAIQLAFPREGCASSTVECEALLASLRIAAGLGISRLSIRGDSQLTVDQAEGTKLSPLMKAYAGEM